MATEPVPAEENRATGARWALSIGAAALAFTLYDGYLNDFVASPLREVSSVVAHFLLRLVHLDAYRAGTILTLGELRFDVVPACNGSAAIKSLLGLGIVWAGIDPRLDWSRKAVAAMAAVPVAIAANGVRVAALVAASAALGYPIEAGTLHTLIGLLGFLLALAAFLLLTDLLARGRKKRSTRSGGSRWRPWALGLLLLVLYGPYLYTLITVWSGRRFDPYDTGSPLFAVLGGLGLFLAWRRGREDEPGIRGGTALALVALLLAPVSQMIDLHLLLGASGLLLIVATGWLRRGWRFGLGLVPLACVLGLSFPKVPLALAKLTGLSAPTDNLLVRGALALVAAGVAFLILRPSGQRVRVERTVPSGALLIGAAAAAALQAYFGSTPFSSGYEATFVVGYDMNGWIGQDMPVDSVTLGYFGRGRIWNRLYRHGSQEAQLIVNSSGGDRHRNHPPEYCQTGMGWTILDSRRASYSLADGHLQDVALLTMELNGQRAVFAYWFSDGEETYADYSRMMAADTLRRLGGRRTDWFLIRVLAEDEEALRAFLSSFDGQIQRREDSLPSSPAEPVQNATCVDQAPDPLAAPAGLPVDVEIEATEWHAEFDCWRQCRTVMQKTHPLQKERVGAYCMLLMAPGTTAWPEPSPART